MNNIKLATLFLINHQRINKRNKCPLRCRITYLQRRKEFSLGIFISPDYWNSKKQKAEPPNPDNNYINTQLSLISQKINEAFLFLQVNQEVFNVEDIYLQYKGENTSRNKTLIEVFNMHNRKMEKLIGKSYARSTYYKFKEAKTHLINFLKHSYKKGDIRLSEVNMKLLDDFDFYLKSELNHKQITINKSIQRLRKIIKLALAEGYLDRDPFLLYKPKKYNVEVVYLSTSELSLLESQDFTFNDRLERVRDCFVFCCYTGLAYAEMASLHSSHIIDGFDGNKWIKMKRRKTGREINVPLLPVAVDMLEKYEYKLPIISNQKFNTYLKQIGVILGIKKKLTHHIARKTFATTVLLYNNVPMEIVSELLGHSNLQVTQSHYGKILNKGVSKQMEILKLKLGENQSALKNN